MSSIREIALAKAVGGGGPSVTVEELTVTENGTTTAPSGKAYSPVNVAVPNTYSAGDEGKVVSGGALVGQTAHATVTENGTIDTTLNNSVVVDVPQITVETLSVTENGTYTAPSGKAYSSIVVNVVPPAQVYGVEWDYNNSSTVLLRTGDAAKYANPAPATSLSGTGTSPFDDIQPWAGMKRYNVVNGTLVPDTDPSFDEAAYDTVVYIPEFYYKASKDTANHKWNWSICPSAKEGYEKHPGSGCYVGRFHTSGDSSAVYTKGGVAPLANETRANFRTYSAGKGTGWRQMDLKTWSAIQLLYIIEFANWNSQDVLGGGQNSGSLKNTGATTGAAYHTIKRTGDSNTYRWIENPFSNVYTWVDGFVASNKAAYIATDPASYGDTTNGMEAAGITLPSSGFITGLGYSEKCAWAFIPDTASGGSATKKIPDFLSSDSGTTVLCVGGDWGNYGDFGLFCFRAIYSASIGYAGNGSRLFYQP